GEEGHVPDEAIGMIGRIGPGTSVTAVALLPGVAVYRTDLMPSGQPGGIGVYAARLDLLDTVGASVVSGTWLNDATARYPAVVLGSAAAERLGVPAAGPEQQVYLGGEWFTVVGLLGPAPLAPELDSGALVGWPVAQDRLGFDGYPTTVYTRVRDGQVEAVQAVLAATANPQHPDEVEVSRPS